MNLPKISISKPSFSFRFFIYFLFGLVVLVLAVEGGYYFLITKSKSTRKNLLSEKDYYSDTRMFILDNGELVLIKGVIQRVDGRNLFLSPMDSDLGNSNLVKVEFKEEPFIKITYTNTGYPPRLKEDVGFEELKVGDLIVIFEVEEENGSYYGGGITILRRESKKFKFF